MNNRPILTISCLFLFGFVTLHLLAAPVQVARSQAPPAVVAGPLLLDGTPTIAKTPSPVNEMIRPWPVRTQVGFEVLVDGRPQPTVQHGGKTYLPVRRTGAEYDIRVWNHGPYRITAIVSVDGLSVINGEPASEDHPGYIVAPYGHVVINGWRRNMEMVAAFRFVDRTRSYANLVGRPENIGVIGLVAFEELAPLPRLDLEQQRLSAPAARERNGSVGSIGTEYGREVDSRAYYVDFVRSNRRHASTIYYDTVDALREAGVPVDGSLPVPFPADKFAPPPPGYKG